MNKLTLDLGEVQFYWRMSKGPAEKNSLVPAFLPFAFSFEPKLGLVIQQRNPLVADWLKHIYELDSNVGYLQEGHALAESYGSDFLNFMQRTFLNSASSGQRIFEIGCGGGYLLSRLAAAGHDVAGIDPSPVAARVAKTAGFRMFPEFYPSESFREEADLIFHYDVLEHVDDPVIFLRAHHRNLRDAGHIVVAVPDCTEGIARGDISMLIHEHLNYFDLESLRATVSAAGFVPLSVERSRYGNVLYCVAVRASGSRQAEDASPIAVEKFTGFVRKAERARACFRDFVGPALEDPRADVSLYVPLRLIPYLCALKRRDGFRFFDDDPGIRGKYFDGFPVPVEGFDDFVRRPPTHAIIGSFAFADVIRRRISENVGRPVEIMTLRDIASDD